MSMDIMKLSQAKEISNNEQPKIELGKEKMKKILSKKECCKL